jgi:hypothetical protein
MTSNYSRLALIKSLDTSNRTPQDKRVYVMCAFIRINGFKIHHVSYDMVFVGDAVPVDTQTKPQSIMSIFNLIPRSSNLLTLQACRVPYARCPTLFHSYSV